MDLFFKDKTVTNNKVKIIIFIIILLVCGFIAKNFFYKPIKNNGLENEQNPIIQSIKTNLYELEVKQYRIDFGKAPGLYSAIDMIGDSILWASSYSDFYLLDDSIEAQRLNIPPINMNRKAFLEAVGEDDFLPNKYFSLKDISVVNEGHDVTIYASHHYWNENCYTVRLSSISFSDEDVRNNQFTTSWKTIFETSPCLPLFSGENNVFRGDEAGGRIAHLNDGNILLTIGHHEFNGLNAQEHFSGEAVPNYPQDTDASYGKIVLINPTTGADSIYSSGHRNPQGLLFANSGLIFSTEHGPKGGDELNIITKNGNYGWPNASYGTQYNEFTWPLADAGGFHVGYSEPFYAWVPSVAISNVIQVKGDMFKNWQGDLLIGSMKMRNIYRVKYKGGKVLFAEPIHVDLDVRDIMEKPDGTIIAINRGYELIEISLKEH